MYKRQVRQSISEDYNKKFNIERRIDYPEDTRPSLSEITHPRLISKNRISTYWKTFLYTTVCTAIIGGAHFGSDGSYCVSQDMYGCYEYEYDDNFVPSTFDQSLMFTMILYPKLLIASMLGARQGIWVKASDPGQGFF